VSVTLLVINQLLTFRENSKSSLNLGSSNFQSDIASVNQPQSNAERNS